MQKDKNSVVGPVSLLCPLW